MSSRPPAPLPPRHEGDADAAPGVPGAVVADVPPTLVIGGPPAARAVEAATISAPASVEPEPGAPGDDGAEAVGVSVAVTPEAVAAEAEDKQAAALEGTPHHASLDRSLMRGIAWTGSVKLTA